MASPTLESVNRIQLVPESHVSAKKIKVVLITSVIGLTLGLSVLAIGISLVVVFGSQFSSAFYVLMGFVLFSIALLLVLNSTYSRLLYKLLRLQLRESTSASHLQQMLLEKEQELNNLHTHCAQEVKQLRDVLEEKSDELEKILALSQVATDEKMQMEVAVNKLRAEVINYKKEYSHQIAALNVVLKSSQESYELLFSDAMVLKQSLDLEKGTTSSLQSQLHIVMDELELTKGVVKSQEEELVKLTEKKQELEKEISSLQKFISDKVTSKDSTS